MKPSTPIPIVFFGTQEFAATILDAMIKSELFDIRLVITQPDRPVGRRQELQASPVKILAQKYNLTIDTPETLKNYPPSPIWATDRVPPIALAMEHGRSELRIANCKLFIVAQYGLLIPKSILDLPARGTINVHTSLLPKYRGASPIQSAIINGEEKTGITIMLMDVGLDTGPILSQKEIQIGQDETYQDLDKRMTDEASTLLLQTIPLYLTGEIAPIDQDNSKATACKKFERDDGHVDWAKSASEIYNLYRGLFPWPGVWTLWNEKRIKLLAMKKSELALPPGQVQADGDNIFIGSADGSLQILELQIEGKQKMTAKEFLNGYKNFTGVILK